MDFAGLLDLVVRDRIWPRNLHNWLGCERMRDGGGNGLLEDVRMREALNNEDIRAEFETGKEGNRWKKPGREAC